MATSTARLEPTAAGRQRAATGPVAERVAELRRLAETDPVAAQETAWAWFVRLGRDTAVDRESGAERLADLFGCGQPSAGIDGATDGILVAPLIQPRVDAVARRITALWMPWMGKRFDAASARGDNRLTAAAGWAAKLLWPLYPTRAAADGRLAFDFETRVERGAADPDVDVLVIDYAPVARNPRLVIRSIRDELVEIVPGAHLGRILYRRGNGYTNIGYFALRTPVV